MIQDAVHHQRRALVAHGRQNRICAAGFTIGQRPSPHDPEILDVLLRDLIEGRVFLAVAVAGVGPPFTFLKAVLGRDESRNGDGDRDRDRARTGCQPAKGSALEIRAEPSAGYTVSSWRAARA